MSAGRHSTGFSLIEALVALVVLAIGLLGIAGIQLKGLQSADLAVQRGIANIAAQDARERLWAALVSDTGAHCPKAAVVNHSDWQQRWQLLLPELATDPVEPLGDCRFHIEVRWQDPRTADHLTRLDYRLRLPQEVP
ncbi:type IV pilus modification protein PilV [Halomonas cupida]|uniref:type IV pilus modification protein PilV n=1 Tax=Halomonas cupida TaxID=44933 RepID=UPI003A918A9A